MEYEFEAPTYVNFAENMEEDESEVSRYFDVDHDQTTSRAKDSPVVILPEGPRDVPSAKKSVKKSTPLSQKMQSKKRISSISSLTPVSKQTPGRLRTPLTLKKTPGSVKRLSRSAQPITPGKVAAALTALKLTPVKVLKSSAGTLGSSSLNCDSVSKSTIQPPSAKKRARLMPEITLDQAISNQAEGDVDVNVDEIMNDAMKFLMGSSRKRKATLSSQLLSMVDGIEVPLPNDKQHNMETRADKAAREPPIQLRSRSIARSTAENPPSVILRNRSQSLNRRKSRSSDGKAIEAKKPQPRSQSSDRHMNPTQASRTRKASVEPFVSLAEATNRFQNRTPLRFRIKARKSPVVKTKGPLLALKATIPQSPSLRVKHRSRPIAALSREEQEAKELEEIRKHKFKPLPLPEKILKPLKPMVNFEKKQPTLPEPFNITEVKKKEPSPAPDPVKFTARPAPKKILQGPVGLGEKKVMPLTDPKSPSFRANALRRSRSNTRKATPNKVTMKTLEDHEGMCVVKNKELAHFGVPFKTHENTKGKTDVKPFSFEERDKNWLQRKEEKIKELKEQLSKKPVFHANPLPSFKTPPRRIRSPSPQMRNKTPKADSGKKISGQLAPSIPEPKPALLQQFKARAPVVLLRKPFEPLKPNRQLPLPDVTLNSEKRAKKREAFDHQLLEREIELEAMRKQSKEEQEKKEQEEIARLRKRVVHKPLPVPKLKQFEPQPSSKPLTDPTTPCCLKRSSQQKAV